MLSVFYIERAKGDFGVILFNGNMPGISGRCLCSAAGTTVKVCRSRNEGSS